MKTNEHYRRVSSGGNESARSSRRGAGLTSSSGGLDSDGPQSHAVVTQKRKLRTPVWARLRNIHISSIRYDSLRLCFPTPSPPHPLFLTLDMILSRLFFRFFFSVCSRLPSSIRFLHVLHLHTYPPPPPAVRSVSMPSTLFVVFFVVER